jgi:molecular chaperone GrpE
VTSSSNEDELIQGQDFTEDEGAKSLVEEQINDFPNEANGHAQEDTVEGGAVAPKTEEPDYRDKYVRLLAEFDNYKKRVAKERADLLRYQGEQIFVDLLEIVDNFERAVECSSAEPEQLREGMELIHRSLMTVLQKWGVTGESGIGSPFDPKKHNALSQVSVPGSEPGTVVNELKKAYFYRDKLIRPGEVVVAKE